jgi:DNA processing protein
MTDRVITPADEEWPFRLREMGPIEPPQQLFVSGLPLDVPRDRTVAIVGARSPSAAGIEAARIFSRGLAEAGFTIVSGLAVGIDVVAHKAALDAGAYTVAVLGCGLDAEYPRKNLSVRKRISETGTIVTEFPEGTPPNPHNFPQRNRIIAGISAGVVYVEGGIHSGGRITAVHALDMNRSVFAVPGSIRNPMAAGPNELIRTCQASLVTEFKHVLDDLAPELVWDEPLQLGLNRKVLELEANEGRVLGFLDDAPSAMDLICSGLELTPGETSLALSRLEIRGLAFRTRSGYVVSEAGGRVRKLIAASQTASVK